jgi:hypothetical protein
MIVLPFRDRTYLRFVSSRTAETLFELKMLDRSLLVWGAHYRPSEFDALLSKDGATVALVGTLRDRCGPVVTFSDMMCIRAGYSVEYGELPDNFDPSWRRDET